jgi:hypothetical protein
MQIRSVQSDSLSDFPIVTIKSRSLSGGLGKNKLEILFGKFLQMNESDETSLMWIEMA